MLSHSLPYIPHRKHRSRLSISIYTTLANYAPTLSFEEERIMVKAIFNECHSPCSLVTRSLNHDIQ
jgi:hypothetical protein